MTTLPFLNGASLRPMAPEERQVLMGEMKMFHRRRVVRSGMVQGALALAPGVSATGGAGDGRAALPAGGRFGDIAPGYSR